MADRPVMRLGHIKERIVLIRGLVSGRKFAEVAEDPAARAALERFLEVISEASRHLPDAWKSEHPAIPWRRVHDLGNVIRHAYDQVDLGILWDITEKDLAELELAVDAMLKAHAPDGDGT